MQNKQCTKCPDRVAAGRLGAKALNGDKEKKSAASRKAAQTRKALNPNCFSDMGRKGGASGFYKERDDA